MSASTVRPRLWLVDGTANVYRAFFALRGSFTTRDGLVTNAVYGFTTMLHKLIRDVSPEYLGICFDRGEVTFRNEMYAPYKANRPAAPDDLVPQFSLVKEVTAAHNIPVIEMDGFEADDLIGTLCRKATRSGFDVVVVASDKDLFQLVDDHVQIMNPHKGNLMMDAAKVKEIFGVRPGQVTDVLALMGDASDNIPGVPGIGAKGARQLLADYGSLEGVLTHAAEIKRKSYRESLQANADLARLSRDLATVRRDAPVDLDAEALRCRPPDTGKLRDLFGRLEFTSLLKELEPSGAVPGAAGHEAITGREGLAGLVKQAVAAGSFALEVVSRGTDPMRAEIVGLALAVDDDVGAYVPVLPHAAPTAPSLPVATGSEVSNRTPESSAHLLLAGALELLRPLLVGGKTRRVAHDAKFADIILHRHGIDPATAAFDTMVAGYLLDAGRPHQLEDLAVTYLDRRLTPLGEIAGTGVKEVPLDQVDLDAVTSYAGARAATTHRLDVLLAAKLEEVGVAGLFRSVEMPLLPVLVAMEEAGVRIDVDHLAAMSRRMEEDLSRIAATIHDEAGTPFNINSPKQLGEVLFGRLGLASKRRTAKTRAFSTSQQVLEDLAAEHPICAHVLEWRSLAKLKGTYVDALPALVNPDTGRLHTRLNQTVAATGRLSSSDPNLQNIPIRTQIGREIRRAFVPEAGNLLLTADYSQVELRILAHLAGDPVLIDAFRNNEDIHTRTAAEIFGVAPELVSSEMRRRAKAVNFGILYGMGPQRLSREQGISMKDAKAFIASYFDRFERVKNYIDTTIAAAEAEECVRTMFSRVRFFPEINSKNRMARQQALRAAVNTTIQGTAADLIKMAMIDIARRLSEARMETRMILQVHDELVFEVPVVEIEAARDLVRTAMEQVHPLAVPLTVDLGHGANWLDAKPGSASPTPAI
ncbi:MAG: DNA polymerase I [Acidobacteriota bacterium]